jgi:hypothetical protein
LVKARGNDYLPVVMGWTFMIYFYFGLTYRGFTSKEKVNSDVGPTNPELFS